MSHSVERHPKGLFVLFGTEMWERFGFYTMLAMLVLYMKDTTQGFGWDTATATGVYSWYSAFVYASPLVGGWIADKYLGCRWSITIGGLLFMIGYLLLTVGSIPAFYMALTFLVLGNGFFKPNVSSQVGNLYADGSHLKDRAYLIFYMGINIGAFLAPLSAEAAKQAWGFRPAFSVAAFGMVIALAIYWVFKRHVVEVSHKGTGGAATGVRRTAMDDVPEWKRILALVMIFAIVIVFWMVFHQNGSTLTMWANDNTDWKVSGIISNAINPFWIVTLSLPLAWFWGWLDRRGLEPSTPAKMAIGMLLTASSFFVLYFAALDGGYSEATVKVLKVAPEAGQVFVEVPVALREARGISAAPVMIDIDVIGKDGSVSSQSREVFVASDGGVGMESGTLARLDSVTDGNLMLAPTRRVSPIWLIVAYFIISLGELMLSPMGLSLVSKVAPARMRGVMMGGWFLATAIGNKLTAIGAYWDVWSHASFFAILGGMALVMSVVLFLLLRPLKRAMPGV